MKSSKLRYLIAFLVPLTTYLSCHFLLGTYPFGSSTLLQSDLFQQYNIFHQMYGDIIKTQNWGELLFQWEAGLGTPFIGTFAYYLSSPFALLSVFFNEKTIPAGMLLITALKIGSIGLTTYWALLQWNNKKSSWSQLFFSSAYALSGYTLIYSMNVMWLDCLILFPILIEGTRQLLNKNKITLLFVALLFSFWVNFYLSYMMGLFLVLYLTVEFFKQNSLAEWKIYITKLLKLCLAALTAASLLAALLFPTLLTILKNSSSSQISFDILITPLQSFSQLLIGSFTGVNNQAVPPIYIGLLPLALSISFFFRTDVSYKEKSLTFCLLFLLFLGIWIDPVRQIWHAFEDPSWFPGRHSFILCYYLIFLAYQTYETQKETGVTSHLKKGYILSFLLIFLLVAIFELDYKPLTQNTTWLNLSISLILSFTYFLIHRQREKTSAPIWTRALLYTAILELLLNGILVSTLFKTKLAPISYSDYLEVLTQEFEDGVEINDPEHPLFYRSFQVNSTAVNHSILNNYYGVNHFNTMGNNKHTLILNYLYTHNDVFALNSYWQFSAHPILDSLLGIRYVQSEEPLSSFYTALTNSLYLNPYALPLGFKANTDFSSFTFESETERAAVERQEVLLQGLLGNENVYYTPIESEIVTSNNLELNIKSGYYQKIDAKQKASIEIRLLNLKSQELFLSLPVHPNGLSFITLSFQNQEYTTASQFDWLFLGNVQQAEIETLILTIPEVEIGNELFKIPTFHQLNVPVLQNALTELREEFFDVKSFSATKVSGTVNFKEDATLFLSIPYDTGWSALLNGKRIESRPFYNTFTLLDIPKGEHELILTFEPDGLRIGILISSLTFNLILISGLLKYLKRLKRKNTPNIG